MDFDEFQKLAMRTANFDNDNQLINAALGLVGEAGEFADLVKKVHFQGHELDKEALKGELGDVLWYVALACEDLGFEMSEVGRYNIEKLRRRYPEGFSAFDSIFRED